VGQGSDSPLPARDHCTKIRAIGYPNDVKGISPQSRLCSLDTTITLMGTTSEFAGGFDAQRHQLLRPFRGGKSSKFRPTVIFVKKSFQIRKKYPKLS
jgi:hypothetical protein